MEFDDDTHLCLRCSKTIVGLHNYVLHRQQHCMGFQPSYKPETDSSLQLCETAVTTKDTQAASPCLSPSHELGNLADDFFSSLELQSIFSCCKTSESKYTKLIKDASDNDEYCASLHDMPTKTLFLENQNENNLNTDDCVDVYPPVSHTGGKWKPGSRPDLKNRQSCIKYECIEKSCNEVKKNIVETISRASNVLNKITKINVYDKHLSNENNCSSPSTTVQQHKILKNTNVRLRLLNQTNLKDNIMKQRSRRKHPLRSYPNKNLECTACKLTFLTENNYARHLFSEKHKKCFKGNREWFVDIFNNDLIIIRNLPYQCYICFYYYSNYSGFLTHIKTSQHRQKVAQLKNPVICFPCEYECMASDDMIAHFSRNHLFLYGYHPFIVDEKKKNDVCNYCTAKCKGVLNLQSNLQRTKQKTTLYGKDVAPSGDVDAGHKKNYNTRSLPVQESQLDVFTLDDGGSVNDKSIVESLKFKHGSIRNQKNSNPSNTADLKKHLLIKKPKRNIWKCKKCSFKTSIEILLKQHKHKHFVTPFRCTLTELKKCSLIQHEKMKCDTNHKYIANNANLKSNEMIQTKTKMYCDNCNYIAKSNNLLKLHKRSHTGERPFKCKNCSYSASNSSQLLRHSRLHTGVKPYSCPYCSYSCNTQENIRKHILKTKKHKGKSMYICKYCEFGCNSFSELRVHLLNKHKLFFPNGEKDIESSAIIGLYAKNTMQDNLLVT